MACSLDAPRGADFTRRYVFPDSYVLTGYPATFNIYETTGGTLLLSVIAISNINDSETLSLDNVITVNVTKEDLALLPENDDPTLPSLLRYELLLTSPDLTVTDKLAGGSFRILPFGFAQRNAGSEEIAVSFGGDDVSIEVDGGSISTDLLAGKANLSLNNLVTPWADNAQTERVIGGRTLPVRTLLRDWCWFDEESGAVITGSTAPAAVTANDAAMTAVKARTAASAIIKKIRLKGQVAFSGGLGAFGDGVSLLGEEGRYACVLTRANTTGTLIRMGHDSKIEGVKITNSAGALAASAIGLECVDKNTMLANDLTISGQYVNLRLASTTLNIYGGHRLRNIALLDAQDSTIVTGSAGLLTEGCTDIRGDHIVIAPTGLIAGRPTYAWKHGAGNSSFWHGLNITDQGYAFYAAPTEELLQLVLTACCLDKNLQGDNVYLRPGVGGSIRMAQFVACEFGNSVGSGAVLDGTLGLIDSPTFTAPTIFNNDNFGFDIVGGGSAVTTLRGVRNVQIGDAQISGNGFSGVYFDQYVKNLIISTVAGIGTGYAGNGGYGVEGGAGVDNYRATLVGDGNVSGLTNLTDNGTSKRVI